MVSGLMQDRRAAVPTRRGSLWLVGRLAALPLMLVTPFLGYARSQDYALWQPEILAILGLLTLAGLGLTAFVMLRRELLEPLVVAVLLLLFLDFQLRFAGMGVGIGWVTAATEDLHVTRLLLLVLAPLLSLALVTWILRSHLTTIIAVAFGAIALSTLILPMKGLKHGETRGTALAALDKRLPPVLHIILDEQIGIAGLPRDIPGAEQLAEDMRRFYARYDFQVHDQAFSLFSITTASIANLLNGTGALPDDTAFSGEKDAYVLERNAWFSELVQKSYRFRIYQTNYLDYCREVDAISRQVETCITYPANSIKSLENFDMPLTQKMAAILDQYVHFPRLLNFAARIHQIHRAQTPFDEKKREIWWLRYTPKLGPLSALAAAERLRADLSDGAEGRVFFAHLMIPHRGFLLNPDCGPKEVTQEWESGFAWRSPPYVNDASSRRHLYRSYFDQVACVQAFLGPIFDTLKAAGLWERATVLVHGDHGSRIGRLLPTVSNADLISDDDLRDNHSTLFAIKLPGGRAESVATQRSIQALFADLVLKRPFATESQEIYLRESSATTEIDARRAPMPRLGRGQDE